MWYFAKNGQIIGPLERADFEGRARGGEFGPDDLVWHADFGQAWRAARTVDGLFLSSVQRSDVRGTGGLTPNGEITAAARTALSGQWGIAIGFSILLQLLFCAVASLAALLSAVIPLAGLVVQLLVMAPIMVGGLVFYLALSRRREVTMGQMFSGFRSWGATVGANLLIAIFSVLWVLMAMIPFAIVALALGVTQHLKPGSPIAVGFAALTVFTGVLTVIIVSLRYSMTFQAIADDPSCGPFTAIRCSVRLTRDRKWKLFCFFWRFLGWYLLCLLTCGIGFLWLIPYMATATATFYDDLKRPDD